MVLCQRLSQWFAPYREQAGAQPSRGCVEHIVALRLLIDVARRRKRTLFVTFVDFSKAYDLVSRDKLFIISKRLGCGMVMLAALVAMYNATEAVIGGAVMTKDGKRTRYLSQLDRRTWRLRHLVVLGGFTQQYVIKLVTNVNQL